MILLSIEILFLFLFFYYSVKYAIFRYGRTGQLISKIRGPSELFFLGNTYHFMVFDPKKLFPLVDKILPLYYPRLPVYGFGYGGIVLYSPEDAEIVLTSTKHIKKSWLYDFFKPWLGEGLLMSSGEKWKHRRKILTAAFHFNILQKYLDVLLEHGEKLVESLKCEKEKTVDLPEFLTYHTLSAICETAMGTSFANIDPEEIRKYREAVFFMGELSVKRLMLPWLLNDFIYNNISAMGRKQKRVLKILHGFSRKIIQERIEYHEQTGGKFLQNIALKNENNDDDNIFSKAYKKRLSMLDLLIASLNDGLINEQGIAEEVDTFIFEGHDTSAMGLVFLIQIFAEYQDVQEKARVEINEMWKACNGKIKMSTLNKLPYVERCIKESLRCYPSVPFISRELNEELKLSNNVIAPSNIMVDIYIYEIHRDPRHWPEPDKFDPDRFLPENSANRHPFAYIPFSAGPRNCIGQRFAMMELKIFSIYLLKNFKLKNLVKREDIGRYPDLVYRPLNKVPVKFFPIES